MGILTPIAPAVPGDSREVRGTLTANLVGNALQVENKENKEERKKKYIFLLVCACKATHRIIDWKGLTIKL